MEYVVDDARGQSLISYAVFEKNSNFVNYDLGQEDIEDRCSMAGSDECRGEGTGARIEPESPTALREAELQQVLKVMRILKTLVLGALARRVSDATGRA
jgi:transcriptional regulator GlxA family with amidase domain